MGVPGAGVGVGPDVGVGVRVGLPAEAAVVPLKTRMIVSVIARAACSNLFILDMVCILLEMKSKDKGFSIQEGIISPINLLIGPANLLGERMDKVRHQYHTTLEINVKRVPSQGVKEEQVLIYF